MAKKALIYGIATYKNRGVEAIVKTTLEILKDYEILIATYDYDNNINKYGDRVKYLHHKYAIEDLSEEERMYYNSLIDPREKERILEKDVIAAIKDVDLCISAGGDNYTYGEEIYLYVLDEEARRQNKKLVFWGGSLFEEMKSGQLTEDMNLFDTLIVRESITYNALKDYVDKNKLLCIPDPAFTLKSTKVQLDDFYKSKVIGINLSPLAIPNPKQGDARFDSVLRLMDYILEETNYNVSLIPHVTTDNCNDLVTLNAIYGFYKDNERVRLEEDIYDCSELKYIISKCKLMIAARTHASIASYSTNVPTLVIGYSVKSRGIAKDLFETHNNYVIPSTALRGDRLKNGFIWLDTNKSKIRKELQQKTPKMIELASKMENKLVENIEKAEKKCEICNQMLCTGCGLCSQLCKHDAITMKENKEGFLYPVIDEKKCTHCNLCKKMCPVLNNKSKNSYEKEGYAVKNKNSSVQKQSTSGGLFNIIARHILKEKGIVYGCEQINTKVSHVRISKEKELSRINGTKYNQSNIIQIYKDIQADIKANKKVLFSGTACQVAGIKKFIGENENLITVSVICHGVMSTKILDKYIDYIEQNTRKKLSNWKYRIKEDNEWIDSSIFYQVDDEKNIVSFSEDKLMNLYIKSYILRESCYQCMFRGNYNPADIIIGDAWGIQITNPEFYDANGVSLIILNSKKGEKFFHSLKIKKEAEIIPFPISDIKKYNGSYFKNDCRPLERKKMFNAIDSTSNELFEEIEIIYNKSELYKNELLLKEKEEMLDIYREENALFKDEISHIYNSKRWRITDKIINSINRVLRRR